MCISCLIDSEMIGNEPILPGFYLERAKKSYEDINIGDYTLVTYNDPSFVFSITPEENPSYFGENIDNIEWGISLD